MKAFDVTKVTVSGALIIIYTVADTNTQEMCTDKPVCVAVPIFSLTFRGSA